MRERKAPDITPREVKPLPQALQGAYCAECDKPMSKWEYTKIPKNQMMCSACMLYKTEWGKSYTEQIKRLVKNVEVEIGAIFSKRNGKLYEMEDTDRIMSAIVLASRVNITRDIVTRATILTGSEK